MDNYYEQIPKSIKSEKMILGSIIINPNLLTKVINILQPEIFFDMKHKIIYETILDMHNDNIGIDLVSVTEYLNRKGELEKIGGSFYLSDIYTQIPTTAEIETHAVIIYEQFVKRELLKLSQKMQMECLNETTDAFEIYETSIKKIQNMTISLAQNQTLKAKEWTQIIIDKILNNSKRKNDTIRTGINEVDKMLMGGIQKSKLYILAGRPSMGKTSFVINIINRNRDIGTLIFSLDQTISELGQRLLSNATGLGSQEIRELKNKLTKEQMKTLTDELSKYYDENKIFVNDNSWDIDELLMYCHSFVKQHNIKLIIIDYMQQLYTKRKEKNNRNDQLTYIAEKLKELSKKLDIPVIALSQLSRALETRTSKRPMLSDLRESGGIEQAANVVLMMYNPEKYGFKEFPKQSQYQGKSTNNKVELIIEKQKDGPVGSVLLHYVPELYRYFDVDFNNYDYKEIEELPF